MKSYNYKSCHKKVFKYSKSGRSLLIKENKPADCLNPLRSKSTELAVANVEYMHLPEEAYAHLFCPCFAYAALKYWASVNKI